MFALQNTGSFQIEGEQVNSGLPENAKVVHTTVYLAGVVHILKVSLSTI